MIKKQLFGLAALVAVFVATAPMLRADSVGFSPSGGSSTTAFQYYGNDGYYFTVGNSPILVTELGYYHDTTVHTNPVGIYRASDQSLMGSTNVTTTTGSPPDPSFDYAPTSILLAANTQYVLVGFESYFSATTTISRQYVTGDDAAHMNPAAGISWDYYRFNYDTTGLTYPTAVSGVDLSSDPATFGYVFIGPNLQFDVVGGSGGNPVPLPASLGVGLSMLAGFGTMFAFRKRLSSRARIA